MVSSAPSRNADCRARNLRTRSRRRYVAAMAKITQPPTSTTASGASRTAIAITVDTSHLSVNKEQLAKTQVDVLRRAVVQLSIDAPVVTGACLRRSPVIDVLLRGAVPPRSEERRVGKECRSRW